MELAELVKQAAQPGIGVYSARVRPTASGFHFEIELDGLNDPMGAVSLDECGRFSHAVTSVIDEALASRAEDSENESDPLPKDLSEENYTLEVSSAGAERVLRIPDDLGRFAGKALRMRFVQEETEHYERVVFVKEEAAPENAAERIYLFKEYIERRKKKKGTGGKSKESVFPAAPEHLRLRLEQILKVNLFLDF